MAVGEFELIDRWFRRDDRPPADGITVGIGDDAAVVRADEAMVGAVARWGPHDAAASPRSPADGQGVAAALFEAVLAELPDAAAPRYLLLGLTLAEHDETWLDGFTAELDRLARQAGASLIGGDTTRGPTTVVLYGLAVRSRAG